MYQVCTCSQSSCGTGDQQCPIHGSKPDSHIVSATTTKCPQCGVDSELLLAEIDELRTRITELEDQRKELRDSIRYFEEIISRIRNMV